MYLLYGGNKQVIGNIYINTKLFKAYSCDACLSMPPLLFNHWVILISRKEIIFSRIKRKSSKCSYIIWVG